MSLTYSKSRPASAAREIDLTPVFPQTPFPEVRKLTKTTLSGNRKLLAASRHQPAPQSASGALQIT